MFPLIFEVTTTGPLMGLGNLTVRGQRKMNGFIKRALAVMLYYWLGKYFGLHFQTVAYARYPGIYAKRRTRGKNPAPLIETGAARAQAEATFRVEGTPKLMKAVMRLPGYVFAHRHIDPRRELSFINRQEADKMASVFRDSLTGLWNAEEEREKTVIR